MNTLTGSWGLALGQVRRDRIIASVWTLLLVITCVASAAATPSLYDTVAARVHAAEAINNSPAIVALYGPILDVRSTGELAMTKMTVLYAVFAALLFVVLVRRHTRVAEERGTAELLAATAVGRHALLAAAVWESGALAVVLGALVAAGNIASGLPVQGSLLFGASWTGTGLVALGVALVAAQLSASARTTGSVAIAALGVLFVMRAVGDTAGPAWSWLSWLTPFGWNTQLSAWSAPRWWVLGLYAGTSVLLVVLSGWLRSRRDLGSGLVAARPGPAHGSPRLRDVFALALRVHGSSLVTWSVAVLAFGVVFGAIAPGIGDLLDSGPAKEMIERLGGIGRVQEAMLAAELGVAALVVTCFALSVVSHAGADEADGRTEQVLATAASRTSQWVSSVVVALLGSAWLLLLTGLGAGIGLGREFGSLTLAGLALTPAVWVTVALAVLLLSLRSSWGVWGWALLAGFLVIGLIGELLKFPQWLIGASPYAHAPKLPGGDPQVAAQVVMVAIAAVVLVLGWGSYRRRDIG